jgi:putative sigma-54 modulation protein
MYDFNASNYIKLYSGEVMTHKIEILGRNMEVTERIEDYVSKKIKRLDRYIKDIDETRVELSYLKSARSAVDRQVAQITVRGRGLILRSEERGDDIYAAFDAALEKMQRQIDRYKGKHYRGRGDGRSAAEVVESKPMEEIEREESVVIRRKKFMLLPMSEDEAIEQMKLLGHDNFFIFYNGVSNTINVLYRRRDGTYGLIEPQLG